eukprot:4824710-Pyramimonas_sp.AAC.1
MVGKLSPTLVDTVHPLLSRNDLSTYYRSIAVRTPLSAGTNTDIGRVLAVSQVSTVPLESKPSWDEHPQRAR